MPPELLRALLTIGFGALAGGLTNTLAVWMLFHPHEPPRWGRRRLHLFHGAIPKNQGLLAEAVGRTVGDRLLSNEDLTAILAAREFREAFGGRLERFLSELLETRHGSLREILPDGAAGTAEELLGEATAILAERLLAWLDAREFEMLAEKALRELRARIYERPVNELLTPAREEELAALAEDWAASHVAGDAFRETVERQVEAALEHLLGDGRTLDEILPTDIVASLQRILSGTLPVGVRKLAGILEDAAARQRLESFAHDLLKRLLRDLRLHQRIVARLVITDETLERAFEALEEEGAQRLSEMLLDPVVQEATARRVNDIVGELLRRPVASLLGQPGQEDRRRVRDALAGWIVAVARDPGTHGFLLGRIRHAASRAAGRSWGDLLDRVPPERVTAATISLARSDAARARCRDALGLLVRGILDVPIGRPVDWLPPGAAGRAERALSGPLWAWIQTQVPEVVRTLDVGRRVEEKVRTYPASKLEETIRRITARELRLIVRLGYLLGAGIGGILLAVSALVD